MTSTETMYEKITSSLTKLVIKKPRRPTKFPTNKGSIWRGQTSAKFPYKIQKYKNHAKKRERDKLTNSRKKNITGRVAFTHVYSDWGIMNNPERKSTQGNKSRSN